jgi:bifunctional DNase/RNase
VNFVVDESGCQDRCGAAPASAALGILNDVVAIQLFFLVAFSIMPVKMRLARIIISELTENQVIYLQEEEGEREFPILIGIFEATNIDRRVKDHYQPPRPLTHDLIVSVAKSLGATVESVIISELNHSTYFAKLRLRKQDGEVVEIDSRPSDAIAVAVTFSPPLPIYVSEQVLEEATSAI